MRTLSVSCLSCLADINTYINYVCDPIDGEGEQYPSEEWEELISRKLVTEYPCTICNDVHGNITALGKIALLIGPAYNME